MNAAEKKLQRLIRSYPSIFGTNQYARIKGLVQMYFRVGGGYEWRDGVLKSIEEIRSIKPLVDKPPRQDNIDRIMIEEENEHVPFLVVTGPITHCPIRQMPACVRPVWRAQAEEVLAYFLNASLWHFPAYRGTDILFGFDHMLKAKKYLRALESELTERIPGWPQVKASRL